MTRTDKAVIFSAFILLSFSIYVHFVFGYLGDKDSELTMARQWLGGGKLYVDIFIVNLPMIVWVCALAIFLSQHLGFLQDYHMLVFIGLCAVAASVFIATRLIAWNPEFANDRRKRIEFGFLLCFAFVFYTLPAYFFDREHAFMVLTFPYVLRWSPSIARAKIPAYLKVAIGCLAAIGFCMKPHTLIILAGIQLFYLLRERSLRILFSVENIVVYALCGLYALYLVLLTPELFSVVMPMAWSTYSSNSNRTAGLFYMVIALFAFALTFCEFRLRYTSPYRKDIFYLVGVCALYVLYTFVNHGWPYTYVPLMCGVFITTGFVLWEFLYLKKKYEADGLPSKQFLFGTRACMMNFAWSAVIVLCTTAGGLTISCDGNNANTCKQDEALEEDLKGAHSFSTVSNEFERWVSLSRTTGATWETRFPNLWMMPAFFNSDAAFAHKNQKILDYVENALAEDLERMKPEVVFIDDSPQFINTHRHVDLLAYFSVYPHFRQAWQHYRFVHVNDYCRGVVTTPDRKTMCRYGVYRRVT